MMCSKHTAKKGNSKSRALIIYPDRVTTTKPINLKPDDELRWYKYTRNIIGVEQKQVREISTTETNEGTQN